MKDCIEGLLTLELSDGRRLTEFVVSAEHAARVVAAWEAGDCGSAYQAAHGGMLPCAREAGHEGMHSHRREG